jgi:GxxExxY protein
MNTDRVPDLRSTAEVHHKAETHEIVGSAFSVLNELGHGLHEKIYENALVVELRRRGLAVAQQKSFEVLYQGQRVGEFIPDLIVSDKVIVDAKVVDRLGEHEKGQMLNYLKITKLRVGLLLNFRYARMEWERIQL